MSQLDQIVKGAPPPEIQVHRPDTGSLDPPSPSPAPSPAPSSSQESSETAASSVATAAAPDPLSALPSSPPQIYLNLLIVESALRAQYLALRTRRRQNTFFLLLLALWIAYFTYALFFRPREDGRGLGGSVYWVVETGEKVALTGGVVTAILIWGTGQWERGMRWPRRWLGVTNRGIRGMNAKVVVIPGPWWKELLSYISFIFPYSAFFPSNTSFHYVEYERPASASASAAAAAAAAAASAASAAHGDRPASRRRRGSSVTSLRQPPDEENRIGVEEDLAPGGDYIRLLLLPKSFSPAFRKNWDEYRTDYWEKENERRARLRQKIKEFTRQQARANAGWLWWAKWRYWKQSYPRAIPVISKSGRDIERYTHHRVSHSRHWNGSEREKHRRTPPYADSHSHSHSRTSSRSSTPHAVSDVEDRLPLDRERRSSVSRRGSGGSPSTPKRNKSVSQTASGSSRFSTPLTPLSVSGNDEGS
ncbi:Sporulation/nuclear morphology, Spo7 [Trichophyton interdigitale]|uniref:Sporulation/nuclear morphology, Spo7 n=1 Tax=Trichophyton interdigitale TaxID=101480 RepID=A0A9P5CYM6_9EURO|nr:Sporulation/nuclear morphology, Spo7 [Trichophyton interdigitale]KAF3897680.1 Sporulation/nuclear morphology, Spo7 [Trichophyton interdigitale]KAG8210696.1 Sporulation/nuclear morphology, Spo7 [Trichophyton interdigitale]